MLYKCRYLRIGPGTSTFPTRPPWLSSVFDERPTLHSPGREKLTDTAGISIVIPAYNAASTIGRCLDSIRAQSVAPGEVVLVNDCSTDDTAGLAASEGLEVISFPERMGPARARNEGAARASGDIILFLDSDVVIPPDLVERIGGIFSADPSISAVQTLYSPVCPAEDVVSRYQNFYYYHALHRMKGDTTATFATWCAAVRKDLFLEAGGFNVSIPEPTVEDEELGYEIADRGGRILLARELQVTHLASYTAGQFMARRLRMARAQAKSGWRSVGDRLLRRYINIRETGTHHSRWVVLSILLVLVGAPLLALSLAGMLAGWSGWLWPFLGGLSSLALSMLCHAHFFRQASEHLGRSVLPRFVLLCLLDMAVLGWGIVTGTVSFFMGRKY